MSYKDIFERIRIWDAIRGFGISIWDAIFNREDRPPPNSRHIRCSDIYLEKLCIAARDKLERAFGVPFNVNFNAYYTKSYRGSEWVPHFNLCKIHKGWMGTSEEPHVVEHEMLHGFGYLYPDLRKNIVDKHCQFFNGVRVKDVLRNWPI